MEPRNSSPPRRLSVRPGALVGATASGQYSLPTIAPHTAWTLDTLATTLGPADEGFTALLLRTFANETFVSFGATTSATRVQDATPGLVATSIATLQSMDAARVALVNLDARIFPAVIEEARKIGPLAAAVARVARDGTVDRDVWEAERTRTRREVITHRDRITRAVASALGASQKVAVKSTTGTAEDDDALTQGVMALAAFIERKLTRGSVEEVAALGAFRVDAGTVTQLRAFGEKVRGMKTNPKGRSYQSAQRALDLQEGRTLALLEMIVGALRAAHHVDASVALPELGALQSWFNPRRKRAKKEEPGAGEGSDEG